jgi:hypothetical protein
MSEFMRERERERERERANSVTGPRLMGAKYEKF